MRNVLFRKGLVIGFIILLAIASILPIISGNNLKKKEGKEFLNNVSGSSTTTDCWPMYRHDVQNTGYSKAKAPNTNNTCWTYSAGENIAWVTPAVVDGKLYFSTYFGSSIDSPLEHFNVISKWQKSKGFLFGDDIKGRFYCLDAYTGEWLWEFPTSGFAFYPASVVNGKVFFSTVDYIESPFQMIGQIYCLNAETGDKIWDITIDTINGEDRIPLSPIVADNKVFVNDMTLNIHCFNEDNGSHIWTYNVGYEQQGWNSSYGFTPAYANNKLYVTLGLGHSPEVSYGKIYCIDVENGTKLWDFLIPHQQYSSPAVFDGMVFVTGGWEINLSEPEDQVGKLYCLNSTTGALNWNHTVYGNPTEGIWGSSSPAVADGFVYFISEEFVHCIDIESGIEKWREFFYFNLFPLSYSLSVADGKIYFAGPSDLLTFYCLNAENGSRIWSYEFGSTFRHCPAIADGWVYVATVGGIVYAFRDNEPPDVPSIDGPNSGKPGIDYDFAFVSNDFEGDNIDEYTIDWGDDTNQETISGPFSSGEVITVNHSWDEKGTYSIKAKAKDIYGAKSNWSQFEVKIPRKRVSSYHWLSDRFQLLERLLGLIKYNF